MEAITMQEKVIKNGKAQGLYTVARQLQVHSKVLSFWKRGQDTTAQPACAHTERMHLPELRCDTSNL